MLDAVYLGNSLQRWIVATAIVLGALILGSVASWLIRGVAGRFRSEFTNAVARGIGGPVTTLVVLFGIRLAGESLAMPDGVRTILAAGITFCTVAVFTWLIANAYEAIHHGVFTPYARKPGSPIDLHLFVVLRTIINVVIWCVGLASALNSVGFEVSAILAGLGIGGMALALASQDTVANVFGGFVVLTQRPFKIGERIEVAGVDGWVQAVGLRNTVVKNLFGRHVLVPNKRFTDSVLVNVDSQAAYWQVLHLRLDPRTTADQLEDALRILRQIVDDGPLLDKLPSIAVDKIGHGFIEIVFWYAIRKWLPTERAEFAIETDKIYAGKTHVNLEILRRFAAADLRFAVPIQAYVEHEPRTPPPPPLREPA